MTVKELLIKNLQQQRRSGEFCDVRLSVGKKYLWGHAAVLCPLSGLLGTRRAARSDRPLKLRLEGRVPQDCFPCLERLLDLIYAESTATGDSLDRSHAPHVIAYATALALPTNILNSAFGDESSIISHIKNEPFDSMEEDVQVQEHDMQETDESDTEDAEKPHPKLDGIRDNYLRLPTGKTHNCIECSFKCYKSADLLGHLRDTGHGGNVCSLCWTESEDADNLKRHFALHEHPKPFFCTFCDMRFQTRSLLGQHLPRHMFQKPYACPHCDKAFKRKHGLNCHLVTHSSEKKHLCDECGFSTTHARILRAHKLTHSGDLFKCSFPGCAHASTRKENMKQHLATHSNEKPFVCELCGHKFTQSKSLKRHSLIHSKDGLDNACPHCPFRARRVDNLKAHVLRQHADRHDEARNFENITIEPDLRHIIDVKNKR